MKKIYSVLIIIFSTLISVIIMVAYNENISNSNHGGEDKLFKPGVVQHNKVYIPKTDISNDKDVEVMRKDDKETSDNKNYLEKNNLSEKKSSEAYKEEDKKNSDNSNVNIEKDNNSKNIYNDIHLLRREDSLESYYYDNKEAEQSVFKVATGEIQENLTTSDKIKLLYVSMQLGKEAYKKVEEYLYAKDAEDGVLKALKLLKEDLSEKEYEKVRKIAEKFIDMDAAEKLY